MPTALTRRSCDRSRAGTPRPWRLPNELPALVIEIVTTGAAVLELSDRRRDHRHCWTHKCALLNPRPRACSRAPGPAFTIPTSHPAPQTCTSAHVHAHSSAHMCALVARSHRDTLCCSCAGDCASSSWPLALVPAAFDTFSSSCARSSRALWPFRPRCGARSAGLRVAACRARAWTVLRGRRFGTV